MRFRVGILDLCVAIVVLVVILLPERSVTVGHAYEPEPGRLRDIALEQARLAMEPGNDEAADRLARLLTEVGQTDWAVQVASAAAKRRTHNNYVFHHPSLICRSPNSKYNNDLLRSK